MSDGRQRADEGEGHLGKSCLVERGWRQTGGFQRRHKGFEKVPIVVRCNEELTLRYEYYFL